MLSDKPLKHQAVLFDHYGHEGLDQFENVLFVNVKMLQKDYTSGHSHTMVLEKGQYISWERCARRTVRQTHKRSEPTMTKRKEAPTALPQTVSKSLFVYYETYLFSSLSFLKQTVYFLFPCAGDWDCHSLDPTVWHVSFSKT